MNKLYVIPGSHACRSAMLMLEHKRVPYHRVDIVTLMHPVVVRLHGFDSGGQTRTAGSKRPPGLALGDLLGTVPALASGDERISTNYGIARFLDERVPERSLLPADDRRRAAVEEAEGWANEYLQMFARRIIFAAVIRDPTNFTNWSRDGRLGYLLYRRRAAFRLIAPWIGRQAFAVGRGAESELLAQLPSLLDRIDGWIADGTLNGADLNVADFMVAPSLALILYRPDVRPAFEGRPALDLVDRVLPEPTGR